MNGSREEYVEEAQKEQTLLSQGRRRGPDYSNTTTASRGLHRCGPETKDTASKTAGGILYVPFKRLVATVTLEYFVDLLQNMCDTQDQAVALDNDDTIIITHCLATTMMSRIRKGRTDP